MLFNNYEKKMLAPYASSPSVSLGRKIQEPIPLYRTEFQRDRDRVLHSTAFRRLEYKTQVFVNHAGDNYRTRLTHSLEVSQIARTVARFLNLNEELTEAICLAHDLGHTPFGHAGQDALNHCMKDFGGFEHNLQSLRIVDELEYKYPNFRGLNLTYETREGILKHCSLPVARTLGLIGERFLRNEQPSLEAQLANVADQIAYNHHDIDDGLRSGILQLEDFNQFSWAKPTIKKIQSSIQDNYSRIIEYQFVNQSIGTAVHELITSTQTQLEKNNIQSIKDVRSMNSPLIRFSDSYEEVQQELKSFLMENLYKHSSIKTMSEEAAGIINSLFAHYQKNPRAMPEYFYKAYDANANEYKAMRVISDYIAGMTDRFASKVFYNEVHE
jgi:dGTPase